METVHKTFQELTHTQFQAHADNLVAHSKTASKKREAVSYLWSVCSTDKKQLDQDRTDLKAKRHAQKKRQKAVETHLLGMEFDFARSPELFQNQTLTDAQLVSALTQNNETVFMKGKAFSGSITISGDNVTLDGEGSGLAKDGTLANSASVAGDLIITGANVTVKNVDFTSSTNQAVRVNGASNVKLVGCKFAPGGNLTDTKWFYGAGIQSGDITIENCRVEEFDSWYLMDASTASAAATVRLDKVSLINNYFRENAGSIAIRGPVADPNRDVRVIGNRFETTTFHGSFWDFCEVSGGFLRARIENNICIGQVGTNTAVGKKGGFQVWSRSPRPSTLYFKGNQGQNLKVFLKIAHNTVYYTPNSYDTENNLIDVSATLSNCAYAFSPVYKKNDGTTLQDDKWQEGDYTPANLATYPNVPSIVNPNGYATVQPS